MKKPDVNIIDKIEIWNPSSQKMDVYIKYEIEGVGEITISALEELTDEQIKDYARYKRTCIEEDIKILQDRLKIIDEVLRSE